MLVEEAGTGLSYPKCLYRFKNKPSLLEINIRNIKKAGFKSSDIKLATGFKEHLIKKKPKIYIPVLKIKNSNLQV